MKKLFVLAILLYGISLSKPVFAQDQSAGWIASFNTFKIGKKVSLHTDVQLRSNDQWKDIQTILVRPGFNFQLNKNFTLTAGYAYVSNRRTVNNVTGYVGEHRIWQQLLATHKFRSIFVSHRFRTEQRFLPVVVVQDNELEKGGTETAYRFRYFLRNVLPIKRSQIFSKGFFAAIQNEVFLNIGNNKNVNGEFFDQNRLYLAAGYRISPKADVEFGYLNQYINGAGSVSTAVHVLQFAGYLRL
jgi:hypothetical protein